MDWYIIGLIVKTRPSVQTESKEVSAKNINSRQITARGVYLTLHHFLWFCIVEQVMILIAGKIDNECSTTLTTCTSHSLDEVGRHRWNRCIECYIKVAYINTHFKC